MKDQELHDIFHTYRPEIDDEDTFMDKLTAQMDAMDANAPSLTARAGGGSFILPIVRTVLSLAALWIIGFFIYLQFESAAPTEAKATLPLGGGQEGASTLKDVYKDYLCQDCKNTISYTQLRNKLYENK